MRPLSSDTYRIFVDLINGNYKKPVRERTRNERNAIVKFWRSRSHLSLKSIQGRDVLYYDEREVLNKDILTTKVKKAIRHVKGGGARSISHSMRDKYTSISEASVRHVIESSRQCGHTQASFTNRPPLRTIQASRVFERVQLDLLSMEPVLYRGNQYVYILTVVDIFSRYLFCRALSSKTAAVVAGALDDIFSEHGWPSIAQCDNGTEFRGEVTLLFQRHQVKVIHGRPYHPQSQGAVERQNRIIRTKIKFEANKRSRRGYNWAKSLKHICSAINRQPKEVLGYQSPFSVYFGRCKANRKSADNIRNTAKLASERCSLRMRNIYRRKNVCAIYKSRDKVLVRYPFGKRIPYKRYSLKGRIIKRGRGYDRYLVKFKTNDGRHLREWVGVENITSRTIAKEKYRKQIARTLFRNMETRRKHRDKYYIVKDTDDESESDRQESGSDSHPVPQKHAFCSNELVQILYDPTGVGNCQFLSVSHQLGQHGLYRTGDQLRKLAVDHLRENQSHYETFVTGDFQSYVNGMSKSTTFGDHLTLVALAREFNCQFLIINSQGDYHHCLVSNTGRYDTDLPTITLGFYPEVHYVAVAVQNEQAFRALIETISTRGVQLTSRSDNNDGMPFTNDKADDNVTDTENNIESNNDESLECDEDIVKSPCREEETDEYSQETEVEDDELTDGNIDAYRRDTDIDEDEFDSNTDGESKNPRIDDNQQSSDREDHDEVSTKDVDDDVEFKDDKESDDGVGRQEYEKDEDEFDSNTDGEESENSSIQCIDDNQQSTDREDHDEDSTNDVDEQLEYKDDKESDDDVGRQEYEKDEDEFDSNTDGEESENPSTQSIDDNEHSTDREDHDEDSTNDVDEQLEYKDDTESDDEVGGQEYEKDEGEFESNTDGKESENSSTQSVDDIEQSTDREDYDKVSTNDVDDDVEYKDDKESDDQVGGQEYEKDEFDRNTDGEESENSSIQSVDDNEQSTDRENHDKDSTKDVDDDVEFKDDKENDDVVGGQGYEKDEDEIDSNTDGEESENSSTQSIDDNEQSTNREDHDEVSTSDVDEQLEYKDDKESDNEVGGQECEKDEDEFDSNTDGEESENSSTQSIDDNEQSMDREDHDEVNTSDVDEVVENIDGAGYHDETVSVILPDLVIDMIIHHTIQRYPAMQFILQRVSRYFAEVIQSRRYMYPIPRIYIRPTEHSIVWRETSVARICRIFGRNSGLMLNLRRILFDVGNRWFSAWLTLQGIGFGWYEIQDIYWRAGRGPYHPP